jgi:hypothetical protein
VVNFLIALKIMEILLKIVLSLRKNLKYIQFQMERYEMKKILYITFSYPPQNKAAAHRALKISTGLANNKILSLIMTSSEKSSRISKPDYNLLKKIPKEIRVLRIKSLGLFEKFIGLLKIKDIFIPDYYLEWIINAFIIGTIRLRKEKFDLIYATGPPFSVFFLGFIMKKMFKIPLILAYRDPWTDNPYFPSIFKHRSLMNRYLEHFLLKNCDGISFISEPLMKNTLTKYNIKKNKLDIKVIPSGFDLKISKKPKLDYKYPKKMKLVLTSTLYGERKPDFLFEMIGNAKNKKLLNNSNFKFHIYGTLNKKTLIDLSKKYKIEDLISVYGHSPQDICKKAQINASLLVDISEKKIDYPSFPYHLWEYFSTSKKILFFGKSGSFKANFIEKEKLGYVLPINKPKIMKTRFYEILKMFKEQKLILDNDLSPDFIIVNSWKSRGSKLSSMIKKTIKKFNYTI